jgi:hypothetical protein
MLQHLQIPDVYFAHLVHQRWRCQPDAWSSGSPCPSRSTGPRPRKQARPIAQQRRCDGLVRQAQEREFVQWIDAKKLGHRPRFVGRRRHDHCGVVGASRRGTGAWRRRPVTKPRQHGVVVLLERTVLRDLPRLVPIGGCPVGALVFLPAAGAQTASSAIHSSGASATGSIPMNRAKLATS